MRTAFQILIGVLAMLMLTQCSLPYQWRYQKVAAQQTSKPTDLRGAWEGTWTSEKSGHHGKLKAIVTPREGKDGVYDFHYHATWAGFISGRFKTFHHAKAKLKASRFTIEGQHDLPWYYGGTYTYEGDATPLAFQARYKCRYDHGEFLMKRPSSTKKTAP